VATVATFEYRVTNKECVMVAVAEQKETLPGVNKVVVILINPTHYDDDGFPYRFGQAVLPSNSLAVLYTLTKQALGEVLPEHVPREIHVVSDIVHRQASALRRLARRFPESGTKLIVGLVAVQTAQFPRAVAIINEWKARGATCVIGGFHVSGSIATLYDGVVDPRRPGIPNPKIMPPEIQQLMDTGTVVFHGEAEETWNQALIDIVRGQQQPLYRGGQPNLEQAPLPEFPSGYFDGFVTRIRTADAGRGCPFTCSFCSIINVQGRKMRARSAQAIIAMVLEDCQTYGYASFFITDDNFARHPHWREILDGLIALRQEGRKIGFMIEADLACGKIPDFLEKLAAAGCSQIFMGVESMNPDNLAAATKVQNKVSEHAELWARCHRLGIAIHAAYIVGFPFDTPDSVQRDIETLMEHGADQASFYMLTPIPGSEDHVRALARGIRMDSEFSRYDSFHPVIDHPLMTREEWFTTYRAAWKQFYTVKNMVRALRRFPRRELRLSLLRNYVWYRWASQTEKTHPMIAGFHRYRDWVDRRPDAPALSFPLHLLQQWGRRFRYAGCFVREFFIFQHVVFEVECAPALADKRQEMTDKITSLADWFRLTFGRHVSRRWLNNFWISYGRKRWNLLWNPLPHVQMVPHAISEVVYALRFATMLPSLVKLTTK
jgi:radical SAM superfamily enzyme YgiQ (UPF0313 family)